MTMTKIAVAGALVLLAFLCWLAAAGLGAAREGLVSFFALVVLVAGGNLLSGRAGPYGGYGRRHQEVPGPGPAETAPDGSGAVSSVSSSAPDERGGVTP